MRHMLISATAALLCGAALPAAAQANFSPATQDSSASGAQSGSSAQQQRTRTGDPNRRICVSDRLSDSRIRRRICRTQAEWDSLQQNDDPSLIR